MTLQRQAPSWSFLELRNPQPGEKVIDDRQIVLSLVLLKDYAATDSCTCLVDEGNEPDELCRRCAAQALLNDVSKD